MCNEKPDRLHCAACLINGDIDQPVFTIFAGSALCYSHFWAKALEADDVAPPPGWHICDCSEDCGAWEPDEEERDE